MNRLGALALILVVTLAACSNGDTTPLADGQTTVPLFTNLGNYHRSITTDVPEAQQYFDQGLRLTYGFNHDEAIRAFEEGTRLGHAVCRDG